MLTAESVQSTHENKLQTACYFCNYFVEIKLFANCIYTGYFPILVEYNIQQRFSLKKIRNSNILLMIYLLVSNCCYCSLPRDCSSTVCLYPPQEQVAAEKKVLVYVAFCPSYLFLFLPYFLCSKFILLKCSFSCCCYCQQQGHSWNVEGNWKYRVVD